MIPSDLIFPQRYYINLPVFPVYLVSPQCCSNFLLSWNIEASVEFTCQNTKTEMFSGSFCEVFSLLKQTKEKAAEAFMRPTLRKASCQQQEVTSQSSDGCTEETCKNLNFYNIITKTNLCVCSLCSHT